VVDISMLEDAALSILLLLPYWSVYLDIFSWHSWLNRNEFVRISIEKRCVDWPCEVDVILAVMSPC
jgi:hypothetical protein